MRTLQVVAPAMAKSGRSGALLVRMHQGTYMHAHRWFRIARPDRCS